MSVHPDEDIASLVHTRTCYSSLSIVEEDAGVYHTFRDKDFIDIYKEFYPYAFFLAKSIVSDEDVPDMVASAFCKLWLKKDELKKIQYLKGYIRTTVKNTCLDHLSKETDRRREEILYAHHLSASWQEENFKNEAGAEKLQRIYSEMEKLPARCQEIFKLAYIQNLKNGEIAKLLRITNRTVINQKSYALKTLRMALLTIAFLLFVRVFA